jgi:hypothetical protein
MPKTERAESRSSGSRVLQDVQGSVVKLSDCVLLHMSAFGDGVEDYDTPEGLQECSDQARAATYGV